MKDPDLQRDFHQVGAGRINSSRSLANDSKVAMMKVPIKNVLQESKENMK